MAAIHLARYVLFAVVLLFSLIVLGISANLTNLSRTVDGFTFSFEGLCVAVSVLTFVTVIPMLTIDFLRRGAFASLVAVELGWVFVLTILWIAAAGQTSATAIFGIGCDNFVTDEEQSICHQFQAVEAFAWLNFILLFGWEITLVVSSAIAHTRGNPGVWTSSVSDTEFFGKGSGGHSSTTGTANSGYPPQQGYPSHSPAQV